VSALNEIAHGRRQIAAQAGKIVCAGGLGSVVARSLPARTGRSIPWPNSHRRLRGFSRGDSYCLSAGAPSALLGAQDAEHSREGAELRLRRSESRSPGHLPGPEPGPSRSCVSQSPRPLAPLLSQDLPELLSFFAFPRHLWRKLRTTNVIERCFVEVRRRTRPMVCFVNVESVDRIIYSIFQRFNLEWKTRTLNLFTQAA
jgi:hypothetical protein